MCSDENSEKVQLSNQRLQEVAEEVSRVYGIDVETIKNNIKQVLEKVNAST